MYKVCLKNKISSVGKKIISKRYEIVPDISDVDAVMVRSEKINDIDSKLLAIARAGAGVNNINVKACNENGVVVFNTPGCNANAVKELTLAGMFLAARNIIKGAEWLKQDDAISRVEQYKKNFAGTELCGKKILVIGLGEIGTRVANSCIGLGMQVYGFDPFLDVQNALNLDRKVKVVEDYTRVSAQSDYVTIHVPFNDSTKNMLDKKFLDNLKSKVVLLNFSRGGVVDADALYELLMERNKSMKYVTDFADEKLLQLDSVIALPHLGASTAEAQDNCAQMAAEHLVDYLENGNIKNSVNFPDCFLKERSGRSRITVACKNVPNVLGKIASTFGAEDVNICNMISKSKNQLAYAMFDLYGKVNESVLKKLYSIDGVIKVRLITEKGEDDVAH